MGENRGGLIVGMVIAGFALLNLAGQLLGQGQGEVVVQGGGGNRRNDHHADAETDDDSDSDDERGGGSDHESDDDSDRESDDDSDDDSDDEGGDDVRPVHQAQLGAQPQTQPVSDTRRQAEEIVAAREAQADRRRQLEQIERRKAEIDSEAEEAVAKLGLKPVAEVNKELRRGGAVRQSKMMLDEDIIPHLEKESRLYDRAAEVSKTVADAGTQMGDDRPEFTDAVAGALFQANAETMEEAAKAAKENLNHHKDMSANPDSYSTEDLESLISGEGSDSDGDDDDLDDSHDSKSHADSYEESDADDDETDDDSDDRDESTDDASHADTSAKEDKAAESDHEKDYTGHEPDIRIADF